MLVGVQPKFCIKKFIKNNIRKPYKIQSGWSMLAETNLGHLVRLGGAGAVFPFLFVGRRS